MQENKFDAIQVGDETEIFHTITTQDIDAFIDLTGDNNPLHTDIEFASKILTDWLETGNQYFQEWSKGERKSIIQYRTDGSKFEVDLSDFYNIVKNNKDPRTGEDYVKADGTPYTAEEKSEMSDLVKKGIMGKSTVEDIGTQFQRMLENWKRDNNKK